MTRNVQNMETKAKKLERTKLWLKEIREQQTMPPIPRSISPSQLVSVTWDTLKQFEETAERLHMSYSLAAIKAGLSHNWHTQITRTLRLKGKAMTNPEAYRRLMVWIDKHGGKV